jgi:hypothetical protein
VRRETEDRPPPLPLLLPSLLSLPLLQILLACTVACSGGSEPPPSDLSAHPDARPDAATPVDGSGAPDLRTDTGAAPDVKASPCPPLMALVNQAFCIDRYEGALEEQGPSGAWAPASPYLTVGTRQVRAVPAKGTIPQGYISGTEAGKACAAAGKRLCTSAEWLAACRGPASRIWPYGDTHVAGACNDDYVGHPVVKYFGTSRGIWDAKHMNDPGINQQPGTVAKGGAHAKCLSHWGVLDMHGNLHEWVSDAAGTFRGGFYADAAINGKGCLYVTTAHATGYHDYSTGFRCCADRSSP